MDSFAELTRYTAAMGATPMAVKKILVLTTTYVSFGCLALLRQHDITIGKCLLLESIGPFGQEKCR